MKKKIQKIVAVFLAINILFDAIYPTAALALTGGPSQPEVVGFTPIGTSDMVNVYSGDFNYNIPLMDVGGYPLNISYQSGVSMDQEASWVGLGWSLNPGVIQRSMRSLPDEFNGDEIEKSFNIKPNTTYGIKFFPEGELFGINTSKLKKLGFGLGLTYNNYTGFGFSVSIDLKTSSASANKGSATGHLGLSAGSESGVGVSPSLSFEKKATDSKNRDNKVTGKIGLAYNSRAGLQALTISTQTDRHRPDNTDTKKNEEKLTSRNGGSSISFASPCYSPQSGHSMLNTSLSVSITLGGQIFGLHPEGRLEGFFSGQFLLKNSEKFPAYGYMNTQNGTGKDKVLLDYNREKDGSFNEKTPALPLTNFTYDVYSVSGQGIGGMYRAHRSDIGVLFDSKSTNVSGGIDFPGIELGAGNTAHPGINLSLNESNSRTGKWEDNNGAAPLLAFIGSNGDPTYETYYFKQAGEKNAESDPDFFDNMGGFSPVRIALDKSTENVPTQGQYVIGNGTRAIDPNHTRRNKRVRKNEDIALLTASEAAAYGDIKEIENYPMNAFPIGTNGTYKNKFVPNLINRVDATIHKSHHTSQITSYRADGAKYVYGIPAYNKTEEDLTFAIELNPFNNSKPTDATLETGLVDYEKGVDDQLGNKKGDDHYFDKTKMPAYAHSYMLTEVLSADYVDVDGNGPSEKDLGTYTKINYSKINNDYKWRVPYSKANYNEGFKTVIGDNKGDDKGSYIYGEKELWYIHSIETKNYVAEFTVADRLDGFGVDDKDGGLNSMDVPVKKLMKITLYSKQDLLQNGQANATPIKTVHFQYDYSLCKGIPNNTKNSGAGFSNAVDKNEAGQASGFPNQGGKLTLTGIYFTYGKSEKGKLSPYEFTYADRDHNGTEDANVNPDYNLKGYDRWGNFKPNTTDPTHNMTTSEFPYVEQTGNADIYAAAWHMTSVKLPSGGVINVDYEADDYAYVQNKKAMQMIQVMGTTDLVPDKIADIRPRLYNNANDGNYLEGRNYLVFKADPSITNPTELEKAYFQEKDGTRMKYLYFKFFLDLGRVIHPGQYEYVPGYCQIENSGLFTDPVDHNNYGWVKLKSQEIADVIKRPPVDVNPISQAGWNYTKLYLPKLAYAKPDPSDPGVIQILQAMVTTLKSIVTVFEGFYNGLRLNGMSRDFVEGRSFIRLYNPVNSKKGGGSRVHKLVLSDSWNSMTGLSAYQNASYGQEYDYTTTDEYGKKISSGVAAYEPLLGGDENPFREPVVFEVKHLLAASDDFYQEKPYGESFFPGPGVGYSKVTVKNLQYSDVKRNATGKVVNEFYTAKDFPTITSQTSIEPVRKKPNPLLKLLKIKSRDYLTASQGFVVETSDMPGKPMATWVYQEGKEEPISGVEYIYKGSKKKVSIPSVPDGSSSIEVGSLDNNMLAIEKNGSVGVKMVGVDYDFVTDMREQKTTSRSGGLGGNLEAFLVAAFPALVPMILPSYSQEKVRFRSAVTTKVINRYGILEETIAHDLGSTVSTKNIMLDAETGEVLLTKTINQFDDPIYALTYPAHWEYDRMGPAYKNIGIVVPSNVANPGKYFVTGDEIEVINQSGFSITFGVKAWIKSVAPLIAIDISGNPVNLSGKTLKILSSGRTNQHNTPIGNVTSLLSPLKDNGTDGIPDVLDVGTNIGVLNASAIEFSDEWGLFCECGIEPGNVFNPYVLGTLGNWRAIKSYLHLTGRTQSRTNDNTNVRKDGIYTAFSPFWTPAGGTVDAPNDWNKNTNNWQFTSEVTIYSPFGEELENKDALGRYSSAIYGYNHTLPLAVSANAMYKEIAFDGFEDYDFNECLDDHFSYKSTAFSKVEKNKSHTGKRSIKVEAGQSVEVKKILEVCPPPPGGGS